MNKGTIYLVGAGPGDPELITVRGRRLIERADVIVYDRLVPTRLLDAAGKDAELIYVGKSPERHTLSQAEINELLVSRASEGAKVVRLKGGDPFIFGRGGEEALAAAEANVPFEVVPGVTAAVAAAACAGIPVTHRKIASEITFVTGHEDPEKGFSQLDFASLASRRGTLAFYMGVGNLESICRSLIENGMAVDTPAAAIQQGATPWQRTITGTLETLAGQVRDEKLHPPAIVIIGRVVSLRDRLRWFEDRPLFARYVLVTRARSQSASLVERLERLGARVVQMPAIRIEPPDDPEPLTQAAIRAGRYDWIVFTSVNGVNAFFGTLGRTGADARSLGNARVCAIGPATAERLERSGIRPDAQPARALTAEIAAALEAAGMTSGDSVLCPRADIAPPDLPDALKAKGAVVEEVIAYRTVPDGSGAAEVQRRIEAGEIDWITFTSASTVRNFFSFVDPAVVSRALVKPASIGPVTSAALGEFGLSPAVEAKSHTIGGLLDAMMNAAVRGH